MVQSRKARTSYKLNKAVLGSSANLEVEKANLRKSITASATLLRTGGNPTRRKAIVFAFFNQIRENNGFVIKPFMIALIPTVCAVVLKSYQLKYPNMFPEGLFPQSEMCYQILNWVLGMILVFRTSEAYSRFWDGATNLHLIHTELFDACAQVIAFAESSNQPRHKIEAFKLTIVRLFSLLHAVAMQLITEIDDEDIKVLGHTGLDMEQLQFMRSYHRKLRVDIVNQWLIRTITQAVKSGILDTPAPIVSRVYQECNSGLLALANMKAIAELPFPVPYAKMVTLLLACHLVMTPLSAVAFTNAVGWAGIFSFMPVFSLWCIQYIAIELEQPFGDGADDLDLASSQTEMNESLRSLLYAQTQWTPDLDKVAKDEGLEKVFNSSTDLDEMMQKSISVGTTMAAKRLTLDDRINTKESLASQLGTRLEEGRLSQDVALHGEDRSDSSEERSVKFDCSRGPKILSRIDTFHEEDTTDRKIEAHTFINVADITKSEGEQSGQRQNRIVPGEKNDERTVKVGEQKKRGQGRDDCEEDVEGKGAKVAATGRNEGKATTYREGLGQMLESTEHCIEILHDTLPEVGNRDVETLKLPVPCDQIPDINFSPGRDDQELSSGANRPRPSRRKNEVQKYQPINRKLFHQTPVPDLNGILGGSPGPPLAALHVRSDSPGPSGTSHKSSEKVGLPTAFTFTPLYDLDGNIVSSGGSDSGLARL